MVEHLLKIKSQALRLSAIIFCRRAIYAGIAGWHGLGCWLTGKPELYGPIAILYGILALRG